MPEISLLLILIVVFALIFDYINGFHDTANAIATVVSTRVLSPRTAILMAASLNFLGALISTSVAETVAGGLVGTYQFASDEIKSPSAFAQKISQPTDPVSTYLHSRFSPQTLQQMQNIQPGSPASPLLTDTIVKALNQELNDPSLYSQDRFAGISLSKETKKLLKNNLSKGKLEDRNRSLLEEAYPKILDKSHSITQVLILAAIIGAIVWNLITWKYGIPSSSSHALIGGLVGAAIIKGGFKLVFWKGLTDKVILPLLLSPVAGFIIGFVLMMTIFRLLAHVNPGRISSSFRRLQLLSAASMAFSHGSNDAQKSMGIITMALVTMGILKHPNVPLWVIIACATSMAFGTSAGGWRIIKTMGHRIIRLEPVHGFAAESSAATVILIASHFGMPVSTTHVIAGSIFGVGSSKRLSAVRWGVAQSMVIAWVLTIPASGLVGGLVYLAFRYAGMH
jgi:PiT family inorganic phosphate transporter